MRLQEWVACLFFAFDTVGALRKADDSILLSNVKTLTLRQGLKTSHRRVAAVPQLKCVGGNAKGLYEVDVMRCKNQGSDYDDENVQWTCTASLPSEFKLGSTDVICEGYDSSNDPRVLKGSCAVEYRLLKTEIGEMKYGINTNTPKDYSDTSTSIVSSIFWFIFIAVIIWMIYSAFFRDRQGNNFPRGPGTFWGGGGGGGDEPPPPYSRHPPPSKPRTYPSRSGAAPTAGQQGWGRPGFWTGAAAGAAGAYLAGRGRQTQQQSNTGGWSFGSNDNGEGSSSGRMRPSPSSSSSFSSTRHQSSGFGSTSRR